MMNDITAIELRDRINAGEHLLIIDVREQHEFDESNLGGRLIPLGTLPAELETISSNKSQEIVVHCKSGMRSAAAKALMTQAGYENVRNLIGGILAYQAL